MAVAHWVAVDSEVVIHSAAADSAGSGGEHAGITDNNSRLGVGIRVSTHAFRSGTDPLSDEENTLIAVGLTVAALVCPSLNYAAESDWIFNVAPYFWLASIGAEANVPGSPSAGGGGGDQVNHHP